MFVRKSACNGCPECICCPLYGQWNEYWECDECGEDAEYIYNENVYCEKCFKKALIEEWSKHPIEDRVAILQNSEFASDYAQWLSSGPELTEEEREEGSEWMDPNGYVDDCLTAWEFADLLNIDYELTEDQ